MNTFSPVLALLMALALTACTGMGGGSTSSDGSSSAASISDNARGGAQANDSEITRAIENAFKQDDLLSSTSISVSSSGGVVSLSGSLTARAANRAVSLARSAPGVRRVVWANINYLPE